MIGTILNNRYRLDEELGHGGMGMVYRGHDLLLGRNVAVKVLSQVGLGSEGRARLLNEAQAAAKLNHPNIVSVYDAGEAEKTPFIVMELVDGDSLFEYKVASFEELYDIARQICTGLHQAHASGIIHRDLKPENILITRSGVVKLTDFGLARSLASRLTNEGNITGTVFYMAPELALGQPFDGRADLYALGVVLYEVVAGRLPFKGEDPLAVISQHINAPVVPPHTYRPDLPPALEAVILRLLSKSPDDRYQTALDAIQGFNEAEAAVDLPVVRAHSAVEDVDAVLEKLARGRLVGRRAELDLIQRLWKNSLEGSAQLALISGEPGIGKTRLAYEMMVSARLRGAVVLRGGCYEYEATTPYLPFVEALREWVHNQSTQELSKRLDSLAPELAKLAPEIESRLGPLTPNPPLDPNDERLRLFDHLARFLHRLSEERGLLIFIDDIHWADQGTLTLLNYLLRHLRDERMTVLACYREVELDRSHPFSAALVDWGRERLAVRVTLGRLSKQDVGALLASLFGVQSTSEEFTQAIYRETEGNPFFVEEVIKALIEQGQIYRREGRWDRQDVPALTIPQSIKEAVGRRLDRQSQACVEMLHTAAALGKRFSFQELAAAEPRGESELLDTLDEASHAQLIRFEGGENFAFTHDKIREVLYEELNPVRRRKLHLRIGEGLEKIYGLSPLPIEAELRSENGYVQAIAHHFIEAGDLAKGLAYSVQAARQALRVFANDEAIQYFRGAVECAEALELTTEQVYLYEQIGLVYYACGPYSSAVEAFQQALALAIAAEERIRLKINLGMVFAQMGDAQGVTYLQEALKELDPQSQSLELARVNALLGRFHHLHAEWDKAIEFLERARQIAEPLDDERALVEIYAYLSGAYQQSGNLQESIGWANQCIALGERKNNLLACALGYEFLAEDSCGKGEYREAVDYASQAREIAEKIGSQQRLAWSLYSFANAYHRLGELIRALEAANECLSIAERTGEERLVVLDRSERSGIYVDLGENEAAWEDLEFIKRRANESGLGQFLNWAYNAESNYYIADERWQDVLDLSARRQAQLGGGLDGGDVMAYLALGRLDELERFYPDGMPRPEDFDYPATQSYVAFLTALMASASGDHDEASRRFDQAAAILEQTEARIFLITILYYRAVFNLSRGNGKAARADVQRALDLSTTCGVKRMAQRTQALLSTFPQIMEFHVSRQTRERYQFDEMLYSTSGNVIFADFHAARVFAQKMNARRDLVAHPEQTVRAAQINAMGLIDEILHVVIELYRQQRNPKAMAEALAWLYSSLGKAEVDACLRRFCDEFPPLAVYRGDIGLEEYLAGDSITPDGTKIPNLQIALEEMLMLWLANANLAFHPFQELFDDSGLVKETVYPKVVPVLREFFRTQPPFGPDNQNLIDLLRAPALAFPDSLAAQLDFISRRWVQSGFIGGRFLRLLLMVRGMLREEERPRFGPGGPGPAMVPEFKGEDYLYEPERFSRDLDWMPNLVLIAKNTYVWLDQLSRHYQRAITHLDQVPGEELDRLARAGITGLWLIGLWERSPASRTIKQMLGNPEAVASAYSLFSYEIAADLGGEEAFQRLRASAWQRGIRLASDMVPNHMGIDSRWVIEHPDWFIQQSYSPFPSYSFYGRNLSWDERVGIYLEDHYYDHTDAAVVFKRVDHWTGDARYVYHGNDGTSMPWNDTAQLNYLMPEVREAVIQTILHVARKFPVIRFDAAMTLAKRHYHRLWFPEPGSGGDIPSRVEHGLTKSQFDAAFPEEFWREVVDRVAQEAPDTLLLAEAFWLMEGYFVRTLGMHRVYNSAFMNMLRDEKNQEYRLVIKNTLEFDPEIIKRYVNFMNNPDERTAVDQFGKDDKYFGVCAMLATLPGLPMFGHGQIEGFAEKYGMEFRYPQWHEQVDNYLVERHEREIFPLLRKRYLFAEGRDFLLYDFYAPEGYVNEDVFVYSNRAGDERSLVAYHNRYKEAHGWIRKSAAYAVKTGQGDEKVLAQKTLGEALGLHNEPDYFVIYRDIMSRLQFIRNSQEIHQKGLYLELGAYKYWVFLDFHEVRDEVGRYARLAAYLQGGGVPDIEEALVELELQAVLTPYHDLVNAGMLNWLVQNRLDAESYEPKNFEMALIETQHKLTALLAAIRRILAEKVGAPIVADSDETGATTSESLLASEITGEVRALLSLTTLQKGTSRQPAAYKAALRFLFGSPGAQEPLHTGHPRVWGPLLSCLLTYKLGKIIPPKSDEEVQDDLLPRSIGSVPPATAAVARAGAQIVPGISAWATQSREWIDEWLLRKWIAAALREMGLSEEAALHAVDLVRVLTGQQDWFDPQVEPDILVQRLLQLWMDDPAALRFLLVHPYQDMLWFNKESFEELAWWTMAEAVVQLVARGGKSQEEAIQNCYRVVQALLRAEEKSGYRVEQLL